jgi:ABC-type phosphate transport system substrate-binding protein
MRAGASFRPLPRYLIAVIVAVASLAASAAAAARETSAPVALAVIVHPSTPEDDLTIEAVRHVFLGEQQFWQDRTRITLLIQPPGAPEREALLRSVYRMSDTEFRRYWVAKLFRAEIATGPKVVQTNEAVLRLVAAIPGAIGVVPASAVTPNVKVLRINGQLPSAAEYPLRTRGRR